MQPHYLAPHLLYKPPKTVCEFSLCLFLHPNPSMAWRHTATFPCFLRVTETCCKPQVSLWPASWVTSFPSLWQWENRWVTLLGDQLFYPVLQPPLALPLILATCLRLIFINEDFGGRKGHYPIERWFVVMKGGNTGTQGGATFQSSSAQMELSMEATVHCWSKHTLSLTPH